MLVSNVNDLVTEMSIESFNKHFWTEVGKKCNKAIVFIDAPSVEW